MEQHEQKIIEDIRRVASFLGLVSGKDKFSRAEYFGNGGNFSDYNLSDGGKDWTYYCNKAGFETKAIANVSDSSYFENFLKAYEKLGRLPKSSERKKYKLNFPKRRWSSLSVFFKDAIRNGYAPKGLKDEVSMQENVVKEKVVEVKFSSRKIDNTKNEERLCPPIPKKSKRSKWTRTNIDGFHYAPQEETGLIALFAILCSKRIIDWQILDITSKGIDAICYVESEQKEIRVEFKNILSRAGWNHSFDDFDYLVCWENRWKDFPKPVLEVREI
jgi:hypothetical protein